MMSMETHFDVSVVVPFYNVGPEIEQTLRSIECQEGVNVEILVVDDGSAPECAQRVQELCKAIGSAEYHRLEKNQGVAAARNHGIAHASYDMLAFCDADDVWLRNKLMLQGPHVEKGYLCCTECINIDEDGEEISRSKGFEGTIDKRRILKTNDVICSSAVISRQVLGDKRFPLLRKRQDHALWIELVHCGIPVVKINEHLIKYRVSPSSLSGNKFDAMKWSYFLLRNHLRLSLRKSVYYFMCYLVIGYRKQRNRTR